MAINLKGEIIDYGWFIYRKSCGWLDALGHRCVRSFRLDGDEMSKKLDGIEHFNFCKYKLFQLKIIY